MKNLLTTLLIITILTSCESKQERKERIEFEQKQDESKKAEAVRMEKVRIEQEEADRIKREVQLEKERKEKELYDRYISNSLITGSTPYSKYYGSNSTCSDYGCSQIKVRTSNSDVLVIIKKNDKVVRHAFIQAGGSYTFSFPNGNYQAFFYYGKGWNPEKEMKGGEMKGGFITNEDFEKDEPQSLYNNVLEYELILQQNGNFSTHPSNPEEAL